MSDDFSPRDFFSRFYDISLAILRLANKGIPREEFKHKVAETIIQFSRTDVIEVIILDPLSIFFWRTEYGAKGEIRFERCREEREIENFYKNLIVGKSEIPPTCFTQHGSFWTGGKECIPPILKGRSGYKDFSSFLMIPFEIEGKKQGLLALKSRKEHFFKKYELEFYELLAQTLGVAVSDRRAQFSLRERIKELTCLYELSKILHQDDTGLDSILNQIVNIVPPAFQYPDAVLSRIKIDDKEYVSGSDIGTDKRLRSPISFDSRERGYIEVLYKDEVYDFEDAPFLKEEQSLLDTIAKQIGIIIEDKKSEEEKRLLQNQLLHADRLATIGELAAGVAHELNEPLANILGFAQLIKDNSRLPDESGKDMEKIIKASIHAREIVKKLLYFSRQMPSSLEKTNINKIISDSIYFLEARCKKEGILLDLNLRENLPDIAVDPAQINQAVVNLVVNSIQAVREGGEIRINTGIEDNMVFFTIEDNGIGMSEEIQKQIFIPFFTTKEIGQGTGLGLAVVHGIVQANKGEIEVFSTPGDGTKFILRFPPAKEGA